MESRNARFWLGPVSILCCLLAGPQGLEAQCGVTMGCIVTNKTTYFYPDATSPTFIRISKMLNPAAVNCPDPAMNAYGCGEVPGNANATKLVASALTATVAPFCNWVCNCGAGCTSQSISINSQDDGLPVELMDFEIENTEAEGSDSDDREKVEDRQGR